MRDTLFDALEDNGHLRDPEVAIHLVDYWPKKAAEWVHLTNSANPANPN